ncbi:MAG: protein translocase SEC61 complex subunit gamma [Candidatus Bathyarchaeota archaeon]|nr:MAG: protein translocase SEC61 complex subunit gamma [Candidatus Bathyarchaeota archaeon]
MNSLDLKKFISSSKRLIKLIDKPRREELWQSIKISLLGIAIIGTIAFVIKFIATMLQATAVTP